MKDSRKKSLYIGNLSRDCTEDTLRELCGADGRGVTSVELALDRRTGRSRGFGFVEMATDEDAVAALDALRGKELLGRPLKVGTAFKEKGASSDDVGGYDERRPPSGARKRGKY